MRSVEEMLDGYAGLVADHSGVFSSFCWTVIEPSPSAAELDARLGTDVSRSGPVDLDELWEQYQPDGDADSAVWVIRLDEVTALLEINGFAGSIPANLAAWSKDGSARVSSFYWNDVLSKSTLSLAVQGEVQQFDILDDDELDDVPALRVAIESVRAANASLGVAVAGLAMTETLNGAALAPELLTTTWPVVTFRSHVEARPVSAEEAELRVLAAAFEQASPAHRTQALVGLVQDLITATELANEPAAVRLVERIQQGEVLVPSNDYSDELWHLLGKLSQESPPVRRGKVEVHHVGWRRMQAGLAFSYLLVGPELILALNNENGHGPLYHARWALDERWPSTRDRFLGLLQGRGS